ncbi:MAG TPA: HAMP domain-containing sensor histidine kinase [Gemmataceae bacterium]|nr:HAMP domain-containing sensor histidine kinase [Gemmataceae bacterium]
MTASSTRRERDPSPPLGPFTAPSLGLLYLDVRARQLYLLNEAARQLHGSGVPVLENDPTLVHLRTPAGESVRADELPLPAAARGRAVEASYVLSRPGQPESHLTWTAAPLRDAAGEVTAVLGAVCCTPQPPDWHALAGLIHDLRTPLQTLRLLSGALGDGALAAPQPDDLGRLHSAAERALQVSADLLEWCRAPVRGGRRVEADWFALEPFLSTLVQEQFGAAERKGVALGGNLAGACGWDACTDRVRLGRVLANLLSNAVRYTAAGGQVTLTATWRGEGDDRALALEVNDTGAGISPEEQESIFQPFQRGSAGKGDSSGGSGLGLSVVDRLVAELGLRHEFASEYGRGSDFRVVLPQRLLRCCSLVPRG